MAGNSPIPTVTSKVSEIDIAGADGTSDTSRSSGRLRFNPITINYVFTHTISRYDSRGRRRTLNEMNSLVNEHCSVVENWAYGPEDYNYNPAGQVLVSKDIVKFYDTGLCDPDNETGYWLPNPRCTEFAMSKSISSEVWVSQYQITIVTDPYMYEYDADPKTYALFSGPTAEGYGMNKVSVKIYAEPQTSGATVTDSTRMHRYLWTNDNVKWIASNSVSSRSSSGNYSAVWTFKPSVAAVYTGKIGVYINFYVSYTYNGTTYTYTVTNIVVQSGNYTIIDSDKLVTAKEMGYTDQNGMTLQATITDTSGNLDALISATYGHIPLQFIWGTIKTFTTKNADVEFMVVGHGPTNSFNIVGVQDAVRFGDTFKLDNDAYNELIMNSSAYGFYSLESPDNARRKI
jgi:hypothetical protein